METFDSVEEHDGQGTCHCGNLGDWVADPYMADIYGEIHMMFLCDDCYGNRAMDI